MPSKVGQFHDSIERHHDVEVDGAMDDTERLSV